VNPAPKQTCSTQTGHTHSWHKWSW